MKLYNAVIKCAKPTFMISQLYLFFRVYIQTAVNSHYVFLVDKMRNTSIDPAVL